MSQSVEVTAVGVTGPEAVEVLHAHADRVDALRRRAGVVLAGIDLDHPARDIVAVDQLRHAGEADGFGLADLIEAVSWADRQPLPVPDVRDLCWQDEP
ncbi:hypothetical protein [Plantactinospora sp. WMMB782]|uniref:hypothetical protein n=1 Tax=Plantactinospora sp. WMMB782 TaxID=3404121 RepID=UPI003B95A12E